MAYKIPDPKDYEIIQSGWYGSGTNICFDCEKACGGCSWSEVDPETKKVRFQPIPGCKIQKRSRKYNGKWMIVDQIVECPLFERTPERKLKNV